MIMTPLLLPNYGDDCGGPHAAELTADAVIEPQKYLTSTDLPREVLQDASSPPEEGSGWNVFPSSLLNEGITSSALRGQVPHWELSPGTEQGTLSEASSSRNSILFRHHGEGAHESWALPNFSLRLSEESLQQHQPGDSMDADVPPDIDTHPVAQRLASTIPTSEAERPCRPNPLANHDMATFLGSWRLEHEFGNVLDPINEHVRNIRQMSRSSVVRRQQVAEGVCDMQGTNWTAFETHPSNVKAIRRRYHEHPHIRPYSAPSHTRILREAESIFSFQQTNTIARPWIEHYQLRNLVATTSSNDIHYVSRSKVMSIGSSIARPVCIMDLDTSSNPSTDASDFHITALAATGTTLIVGGFRGQFAIQDLLSDFGTEPTTGYVSNRVNAITNHIHGIHNRTNGYPSAVFCSNDHYLRTLDIHTTRIVSSVTYDDVVNCAATSPNGRLRVLSGDFDGALITDADSGRVLEHVHGGSSGHGFACAWADNDIHVATAGQDCQVLLWDARNWSSPLTSIATENTYPTSLRFSPVGGGSPVLIVAEAADTVSIVNAMSYATKQTIDLFGDIAGTAISSDGSQLIIANGDKYLGGLLTFHRHDFGTSEELNDGVYSSRSGGGTGRRMSPQQRSDWLPECELESHPRVRLDAKARRRRGLRLDDILF